MRDVCLFVGVLAGCAGCGRLGFEPQRDPPRTCLEAKLLFGSGTGRTWIYPDGEGFTPPREVWCEQDRRGGGWALALKIDGASSRFAGTSGVWSDTGLFEEDDIDPAAGEAKLAPYTDSSVAEVMLVVADREDIVLPLRAKSLRAALASDLPIPTALGEDEWRGAFGATSLEAGCQRQGFGMRGPNVPGVRIGVVANTKPADCRTPQSFIGVGGNIPCPDGTMLAAGVASPALGGSAAQCTPARVLVFVRDDDRTRLYSALPSCAAHRDANRNENGIYLVGAPGERRRCQMDVVGDPWTNALDVDSLSDQPCPPGWVGTGRSRVCVHSVEPTLETIATTTIKPPLASYREVMVSVIGFQLGSTDGFRQIMAPRSIEDAYLDGLSITTAGPFRQHIASYAAGLREMLPLNNDGQLLCPCLRGPPPPEFVQGTRPHFEDGWPSPHADPPLAWRCESGTIGGDDDALRVLDPLFDAAEVPERCLPEASPQPIVTRLPEQTSAELEARLMTDEPNRTDKEGLAVYRLELWVR